MSAELLPAPEAGGARARQLLLYARDLAALYARTQGEGKRLTELERRLEELARISLAAAEAPSVEAVCGRVAVELAGLLEASVVSVLFLRAGKMRVLATHGAVAPPRTSYPRDLFPEGAAPTLLDDPRVCELVGGGRTLVIPFPGRGGSVLGAACVPAQELGKGALTLVELLGRFVGVVLETYTVEESRVEARRVGTRPVAVPGGPGGPSLGESEGMRAVSALIRRVAPTTAPVLVLGETGTGKELAAQAIHAHSGRRGPFVAVNCGALPEHLVESEVFGHEAGAFTGAQRRHRGKVEQAAGGTLFLDEVGELPRSAQVKLLRFLQNGRYTPVGAEAERPAEVRIVAATNRDLHAAVAAGTFRDDLLFRLDVFTVRLPPLRARGDEVVHLARTFVAEAASRQGHEPMVLSPEAEVALRAYDWPGNVRELRNVIERAVILAPESTIGPDLIPGPTPAAEPAPATRAQARLATAGAAPLEAPGESAAMDLLSLSFADAKLAALQSFERAYLEALLMRHRGNVAGASRAARMDRKNLGRKLQEYGLRGLGRGDSREPDAAYDADADTDTDAA